MDLQYVDGLGELLGAPGAAAELAEDASGCFYACRASLMVICGGLQLHEWIFQTRPFQDLRGQSGGETGVNNDFFRARTAGVGGTIMGRNMFGPVRGAWPDESWRGWWGEDPPFGHDVFVLTRHPRANLPMRNGTTFRFVNATPHEVLDLAVRAAGGQDVVLAGGPATIRQFLGAGLVDEMHLAIAPVVLGEGEPLFGGLPPGITGYSCSGLACSAGIAHARITRTPATGNQGEPS